MAGLTVSIADSMRLFIIDRQYLGAAIAFAMTAEFHTYWRAEC